MLSTLYSSRYMAQFVVAMPDESRLQAAIQQVYPNDHLKLWGGLWLVSDEYATAQQVCVKLGAHDGTKGTILVTSVNGYWGHASKNIWEWLAVKGTPKHGGST